MFERRIKPPVIITPELEQRLQAVLKDYQALANSDPDQLRLLIPETEVWRFFVDGNRQHEGWTRFEKTEPGYLKALFKAFQQIFDFSQELDVEFFKHLHLLASSGVKNTNYETDWLASANEKGQFRSHRMAGSSVGANDNITALGIMEILQGDRPHMGISISFPDTVRFYSTVFKDFIINKSSLKAIRRLMSEGGNKKVRSPDHAKPFLITLESFCDVELLETIQHQSKFVRREFVGIIRRLGNTKTDWEAACRLHDSIHTSRQLRYIMTSCQPRGLVKESLLLETNRYLNELKSSLRKATRPMERLIPIVTFSHYCDQLHAHLDCNTRTYGMLGLSHLLMRNGFPPAILNNPNVLDGFSVAELIEETITGMENVFKLIRQGKLYHFSTPEKLERMTEKARVRSGCSKLKYFQEVVEIEKHGRERPAKKRRFMLHV